MKRREIWLLCSHTATCMSKLVQDVNVLFVSAIALSYITYMHAAYKALPHTGAPLIWGHHLLSLATARSAPPHSYFIINAGSPMYGYVIILL